MIRIRGNHPTHDGHSGIYVAKGTLETLVCGTCSIQITEAPLISMGCQVPRPEPCGLPACQDDPARKEPKP